MGLCNSKKKTAAESNKTHAQQIHNINDLGVGKGMFILSNDGKFKEKYSLG